MKKTVSLLLLLFLVLSLFSVAAAAGAPKILKQPTSQTTDKKGKVTFSFRASDYTPNDSSWRFVDPATGNEYTGPELRELMAEVKGFSLTAGSGKQTVTLSGVPESMNGWEVYAHLVNNGYEIDTEHVRLWYYGMEETVSAAPAASGNSQAAGANSPSPDAITVKAEKVTLYPVDADGNVLEDQAASSLSFEGSGTVAVRSDSPVKYWILNGIRIEPMGSVEGFVLKNITSDLTISAKLDKGTLAEDEIDPDTPCTVTCTGCIFTYHAGGLASVSSGTVPRGATIIVFSESSEAAAKGYSINGEAPSHVGSNSFRLKIDDDTEITIP